MALLEVHRAADRFLSRAPGVQTRHSFSFGPHYDPANTSFGPLVLHDEHVLEPGGGFGPHPHQGVHVVSWVLEGLLVHEDPVGGVHELGPGSLQHLSAGRGTVHSERAATVPTRFVQAWLRSPELAAPPSYAVTGPAPAGLAPVLEVAGSVLHAGRLRPGECAHLGGSAALVHAFVAAGRVTAGGERLAEGDAVRCRTAPLELRAEAPAELLVWEMQVTQPQE